MKIDFRKLQRNVGKKYIIALLGLFSVLLFALMIGNVYTKEKDIKEGQLADETIRANKTIENKSETEVNQKLAEEAVTPEYNYDANKAEDQKELLSQLFSMIRTVSSNSAKSYEDSLSKAKDKNSVTKPTTEDKIATLKGKFEKLDQDSITFYQGFPTVFYEGIFDLSTENLKTVEDESEKIVAKAMKKHIRSANLASVRQSANDEIQYLNVEEDFQQLIRYIVNRGIVINEVANEKKTAELKETARENVNPVMIYQGEIIVREGVQIDAKAMQKLELLGMTNQETSIFPIVSLVLAILLQALILAYVMVQMRDWHERVRCLNFYVLTSLIAVVLMKFLNVFQTDSFTYVPLLFPAAFFPLILTLFINRKTAILASIFQVVFSLFIYYDLIGTTSIMIICVVYIFSGMMATLVKRKRIGSQVGSALLWLVLFPFCFVIIMVIYQGLELSDSKTWSTIVAALAGELLVFLLSVGLHPYIELLLNDDSMIVLNELSNPNQPLLKRLLEEAPGTYHHSMMVASLSANAVAEIGGRSMLTRVACYYHDIGKIKHANFFVENLPDGAENPHTFLLPADSREIIFGHVTEGAKILEKEHMPQTVIDICRQHHGTTLMRYFYVKAEERDPDVKEADFRYPGPKPQTKEAAVVNIADSAEAAVRAMDKPTDKKIEEFVHELIKGRIEDGQFDECNLTMREIRIVSESIIKGLKSSFHSRIKYPKMKSEAEKMKEEQERRG